MSKKFSIIIPVYNGAKTIGNALNSIAAQTLQDFEIIILDGKSTDATLAIIDSFIKENDTINVITRSEKDLGIYDAMNTGIQLAIGDFLYFMGCDDELFSTTVLAETNATQDIDLIYGNVIGKSTCVKYSSNSLEFILINGIHHQGIFYNRQVFKHIGNYDLRFKIAADYHLTLKAFLNNTFKVKKLDFDISRFGEEGLSSNSYDYVFYSYHYRLLHSNNGVSEFQTSQECLNKSIYCCHYLAKNKQSLTYAWQNLMYYFFKASDLGFKQRITALKNMIYWTFKPKVASVV